MLLMAAAFVNLFCRLCGLCLLALLHICKHCCLYSTNGCATAGAALADAAAEVNINFNLICTTLQVLVLLF